MPTINAKSAKVPLGKPPGPRPRSAYTAFTNAALPSPHQAAHTGDSLEKLAAQQKQFPRDALDALSRDEGISSEFFAHIDVVTARIKALKERQAQLPPGVVSNAAAATEQSGSQAPQTGDAARASAEKGALLRGALVGIEDNTGCEPSKGTFTETRAMPLMGGGQGSHSGSASGQRETSTSTARPSSPRRLALHDDSPETSPTPLRGAPHADPPSPEKQPSPSPTPLQSRDAPEEVGPQAAPLTLMDLAYGSEELPSHDLRRPHHSPPPPRGVGDIAVGVASTCRTSTLATRSSSRLGGESHRRVSQSLGSADDAVSLRDASPLREKSTVHPARADPASTFHVTEAPDVRSLLEKVNFSFYL